MPYFVIGGAYSDTTFTNLVQPDHVEGRFEYYVDAYLAWRGKSMAHVDDAFWRYQIVQSNARPDALTLTGEAVEDTSAVGS